MPAQIYDFPACVAEPLVKAKDSGPWHLQAALDICRRTAEYVDLLKDLDQWTPEDDVRIWSCAAAAILDQRRCLEYTVGRAAPRAAGE